MNKSTTDILPTLPFHYECVISKDFGKVYILPDQHIMICELTKEYVTIENFKEIFLETIPIIKDHQINKFIFDKQHLRVFHQPSMEWYFVHWKRDIFELGLSIHRKILPEQPFFKLAVEAGRSKIMAEYQDTIISKLDIQYKDSIKEAIES